MAQKLTDALVWYEGPSMNSDAAITGRELEWLRSRAAEADELRRKMANLQGEMAELKHNERRCLLLTEEVLHLRGHVGSLVKLLETVIARLVSNSECLARIAEKAPQRVAPGQAADMKGEARG